MRKHLLIGAIAVLGCGWALPAIAQDERPAPKPGDQKPVDQPGQKPPVQKPGDQPGQKPGDMPGETRKPFAIGQEVDGMIVLKDIEGKEYRLREHRGKPVVVYFTSIDSPVVASYEKRFGEMVDKYDDQNVVFLAVAPNDAELDATGAEPYKRVREYVKKNSVRYPILVDRGGLIAERFGATHTPTIYIIDAKGMLRYAGTLDDDPKGERAANAKRYAADALESVIAGREVTTPTTPTTTGTAIRRVPQGRPAEAGHRTGDDGKTPPKEPPKDPPKDKVPPKDDGNVPPKNP